MSYEETSFNLGLSEPVSVTICELNIIFGSELLTSPNAFELLIIDLDLYFIWI